MDSPRAQRAQLRAVVATGTGRYGDPWHPFPETSARVAAALRQDGWEVAVDVYGVRLTSRAGEKIDLGIPTAVHQGRHDRWPAAEPLRGLVVPRDWVAVETDAGKVFLFESAVGTVSSGYTEWPVAAPPETAERFSRLLFGLAAFRAALWTAMLR